MNEGAIFPAGLIVAGRPVAIAGDNAEAADKARRLVAAGGRVMLFAPALLDDGLKTLAAAGAIDHTARWLTPAEVGAYFLVLSTRFDQAYNGSIAQACREARVLVSCFDQPALSDISMPALAQRGRLQVAVFTGGASPALARKIRQSLERLFDDRFADFLDQLGSLRERLKREEPDPGRRRDALIRAVDGFEIQGSIKYPDTKASGSDS